jgi:hypothetical protein
MSCKIIPHISVTTATADDSVTPRSSSALCRSMRALLFPAIPYRDTVDWTQDCNGGVRPVSGSTRHHYDRPAATYDENWAYSEGFRLDVRALLERLDLRVDDQVVDRASQKDRCVLGVALDRST